MDEVVADADAALDGAIFSALSAASAEAPSCWPCAIVREGKR